MTTSSSLRDNYGTYAGRDIIFGGSTDFFEVDLDAFKSPSHYYTPEPARALVDALLRHRLVVLGGHRLEDKESFAYHLAWLASLKAQIADSEQPLEVRRWAREVDRGRLLASLSERGSTVFVMPDARPSQFGCELRQLQRNLLNSGHYGILTTNSDAEAWSISEREDRGCWFDRSTEELFDLPGLTEFLIARLDAERDLLVELSDPLTAGSSLAGIPVEMLAGRLKTPSRISDFVAWMVAAGGALSQEQLSLRLELVAGDEFAITRWYRQLDYRRQLLAVGSALFDGLYNDQCFAALEEVLDAAWRQRDPGLLQFDLNELEELRAYFPGAGQKVQIQSRSASTRRSILTVGWAHRQRFVKSALPVVIDLIRIAARMHQSQQPLGGLSEQAGTGKPVKVSPTEPEVQDEAAEQQSWSVSGRQLELWGTHVRREKFLDSIVRALGILVALSPEGLDSYLRSLSWDEVPLVRLLAARALAELRELPAETGSESVLFVKLQEWNERSRFSSGPDTRSAISELTFRQRGWIRETIALTVGFAGRRDPQDQLKLELVRLTKELIEERHNGVRVAFREVAVPLLMGSHLLQLESQLFDAARDQRWLHRGLALGFAFALEQRPRDATEVMDRWYAECSDLRQLSAVANAPQTRQNILAVLVQAYSLITSFPEQEYLTVSVVLKKFQRILAEEKGWYLRVLTLWGALIQLRRWPGRVGSALQEVIEEVTLRERPEVVRALMLIFWFQRGRLQGGDLTVRYTIPDGSAWLHYYPEPIIWSEFKFERRSQDFSVWSGQERPLTELERVMIQWLRDDSFKAAQQIALEALVEIGSRESKLKQARLSDSGAVAGEEVEPLQVRSPRRIWTPTKVERLATFMRVARETGLRPRTLNLLPQFRQYPNSETLRQAAQQIAVWCNSSDNELSATAKKLLSAYSLYRKRVMILLGAVVLVALVIVALVR